MNTPNTIRLEVSNEDVTLHLTCTNYRHRIEELVSNLHVDMDTIVRKQAYYGALTPNVKLRMGTYDSPDDGWVDENGTEGWDAFLFENTDYPLLVKAAQGVTLKQLEIGKEMSTKVTVDEGVIVGTINYHNQVGRTDIYVVYDRNGEEHRMGFSTEVLSYKMDYRTDMRLVIKDIEEEFALLSYSFMKETYLTFKQNEKDNTNDLIWWQIFRDCFEKICEAAQMIISRPKRRLQTMVRYERAERMPYMPPELEHEYAEFEHDPAHLYRMEEMYLSKDTVENRFLKYALQSIAERFGRLKSNILSILTADNYQSMRQTIHDMDQRLNDLVNDRFFRGIGRFKGFSQDSLVMKQSAGYKDIFEQWILLQCGYDLQEGVMQLEVKEISELYEIWCFIKVKNMVQHILRDKATTNTVSSQTTGNLVKQLIAGSRSEVLFVETEHPEVQLASVMYNATTDDEESLHDEAQNDNSDIAETTSKTTEQRPDIVLRLSKTENEIQYTYLFDAKYRIRDSKIPKTNGVDVPPVDAINQMHRYRDAIYYSGSKDEQLKREVIGGYVLYPGTMTKEQFEGAYYKRSVDEVGIGAFPLKPGGHWKNMGAPLLLDPNSPEDVLYQQIKQWIEDEDATRTLVETSIPQKGLSYKDEEEYNGAYYLSTIDTKVNSNAQALIDGTATLFVSGYAALEVGVNSRDLKHLAIVEDHIVKGYYNVEKVEIKDLTKELTKAKKNHKGPKYNGYDKPYRLALYLGKYKALEKPFTYGIRNVYSGAQMKKDLFYKYVKGEITPKTD